MAVSLDGKIASHPLEADAVRRNNDFSSAADYELVRREISEAHAIIVGGNTLRASGKIWSARNAHGIYPTWVIFSNSLSSIVNILAKSPEIRKVVVSKDPSDETLPPNTEIISYGSECPVQCAIACLTSSNSVKNTLLFGGGEINRLFYNAGLVNTLKITISPFILGGPDAPSFVNPPLISPTRLSLESSQVIGDHVFLTYAVKNA
jgi:riboflavin biosynthesis pyrimidine reductase